MQRIDTAPEEAYWKIAITGVGGTGKTSMGVSAPKPLILLSERQGFPSIRQAAKRLGVPVPKVLLVEEAEDYRNVLRALRGTREVPADRSKPLVIRDGKHEVLATFEEWPETIVIDSLTDACDVLSREIRHQSPPRQGRDGLPVDAQRYWGVLIDRAMALIKGFRDLPFHVVFLCLQREQTREDADGNTVERIVTPKLATRDMAQQLCAAVNVMGYSYRTIDKKNGNRPVYGVATMADEGVLTKPCDPLDRYEVPDLSSWIRRLNGHLEDVAAPLPPEALEEPEAPPEPLPDGTAVCDVCHAEPVDNPGEVCAGCEPPAGGSDG